VSGELCNEHNEQPEDGAGTKQPEAVHLQAGEQASPLDPTPHWQCWMTNRQLRTPIAHLQAAQLPSPLAYLPACLIGVRLRHSQHETPGTPALLALVAAPKAAKAVPPATSIVCVCVVANSSSAAAPSCLSRTPFSHGRASQPPVCAPVSRHTAMSLEEFRATGRCRSANTSPQKADGRTAGQPPASPLPSALFAP
jgi:hypothetical protein